MKRVSVGFTLAELLVAMLILGVISTFTIPKVLSSQQDSQRKTTFREAIAALNDAFYTGYVTGEMTDATLGTYMMNHLNYVKSCTNAQAQGCWSSTAVASSGQENEPAIVLHSGAFITGFDNTAGATGMDTLAIDWNGLALPNQEGKDIIILRAIIDTTSTSDRVGTVRYDPGYPGSQAIWAEIFQ